MSLKSRKFILAVLCLVFGLGFGYLCIEKDVPLTEAGLYWASVSSSAVGYFHFNVSQKAKLNGTGTGSS